MLPIRFLRWADVNPAGRAFDLARVRAVATKAIALESKATNGRKAVAIDRAFVAELGSWTAGWGRNADPEAATAQLRNWHEDLVRIQRFIEAQLAELESPFDVVAVERVAARLLPIVVERTNCDDAWYATFARELGWCLEASGLEPDHVEPLIRGVARARFASWIAPEAEAAAEAITEIARAVASPASAAPARDALEAWLTIRPRAFHHLREDKIRRALHEDGHRRFIMGPERERDAARADRMEVALDACRSSASAREALSFERLAAWQTIVLGGPAPFRTTDAFAKGGRERYGVAGARERFDECLAEAHDAETPVAIRAARAYLDVCFFHPFRDGNARAARLALDHVLTREGRGLSTFEPVLIISRQADDASGAWCLANLVDFLVGDLIAG